MCLFELADVIGNGGLGQRQFGGGARKAAVGGHGMEGLELGISHIVLTYGNHKNIRFDLYQGWCASDRESLRTTP